MNSLMNSPETSLYLSAYSHAGRFSCRYMRSSLIGGEWNCIKPDIIFPAAGIKPKLHAVANQHTTDSPHPFPDWQTIHWTQQLSAVSTATECTEAHDEELVRVHESLQEKIEATFVVTFVYWIVYSVLCCTPYYNTTCPQDFQIQHQHLLPIFLLPKLLTYLVGNYSEVML